MRRQRLGGKHCPQCKTFKHWAGFRKDKTVRDGHSRICTKCDRERIRDQHKRDRHRQLTRQAAYEVEHREETNQRQGFLRSRQRRMRENGGSHTHREWIALCDRYDWRCLCCGGYAHKASWLTKDHIVPVSLGGSDDIGNIQPLCRECNNRKAAKTIDYRPSWEVAADD